MCWGKTKLAVVVSCVLHYIFFAFFLTVFNCQTESFSSKYSLQNTRIQENYKCQCSLVNASVNSMQDFVLKLGHIMYFEMLFPFIPSTLCSFFHFLILQLKILYMHIFHGVTAIQLTCKSIVLPNVPPGVGTWGLYNGPQMFMAEV